MRTFRCGGVDAINAGTLTNAIVDPVYDGKYGQPAIVAQPNYPNAGLIPTTDGRFSYQGTWASGATTTPGSSVTFLYAGIAASITFATGPQGGIGFVTLDGAARKAICTYAASGGSVSESIESPSPGLHSITVTYYGDIQSQAVAFSAPANGVGTTVASKLTIQRVARGQTTNASHTITATDSTHVSVDGSGSYALGSTITTIPGITITLGTGTMTTGDTATFSTYATGLTLDGAQVAAAGVANATYETGIVDSRGMVWPQQTTSTNNSAPYPLFFALEMAGTTTSTTVAKSTPVVLPMPDPDLPQGRLSWVCTIWDEDPANPVQSGWAMVGDTLRPTDSEWSITLAQSTFNPSLLAISHWTDSLGVGHGCMGMAVLPRSLFCKVGVNLPLDGFVRRLRILAFDPNTEADLEAFPPFPDSDDLTRRILLAQTAAIKHDLIDTMRDVKASFSLGTAVGTWADQRGLEWNIARPFGVDDSVFGTLLRFLQQSRGTGATMAFATKALSIMLGPQTVFSIYAIPTTTARWVLGQSRLGVDTYLSPVTVNQMEVILTVSVATLQLPPQVVQTFMELFRPVGVNVIYRWQ